MIGIIGGTRYSPALLLVSVINTDKADATNPKDAENESIRNKEEVLWASVSGNDLSEAEEFVEVGADPNLMSSATEQMLRFVSCA